MSESTVIELPQLFPLQVFAGPLKGFEPPAGAFDPEGDWEATWAVHSITIKSSAGFGSVNLRRERLPDGGTRLRLAYDKECAGGFRRRGAGVIELEPGAPGVPRKWEFSAESVDASGQAVAPARWERQARREGGEVVFSDGAGSRKARVAEVFTVNWAMFDLVQRLPRQAAAALRLDLFDDFDQHKPGLALAWRERVDVRFNAMQEIQTRWEPLEKGRVGHAFLSPGGGSVAALNGFSLLGDGTVPWVYYVDDAGRLLFAVSGLEAYIWTSGRNL